MARINYKHLQLDLEKHYLKKIKPVIDKLKDKYEFLNVYRLRRDKLFYSLINHAINIDDHYAIKYILERVKSRINTNISVNVYLYQSTLFNITCLPKEGEKNELSLFVSQHFFNNLNEDEQVGVVGHEISHYLLGQLEFPTHEILEHPFELEEINGLKSDILNWSKACELTADMLGLVANDFNFKAYSTAIIKHHTGLNDSSISKFNISPVVELVLKQYDYLAKDPLYAGEASTHPLTPLRVKVINSITSTKLVKNFGDTVDKETLKDYRKDFNDLINDLIKGIYPEMLPDVTFATEVLPPLMLAVALADGKIDKKEIKAIERMCCDHSSLKALKEDLLSTDILDVFEEKMEELVQSSINTAKKLKYTKHEIVPIIRNLLIVAASDENIERNELEVIYDFAKAFGFSRQDIILILQTHNPIHY